MIQTLNRSSRLIAPSFPQTRLLNYKAGASPLSLVPNGGQSMTGTVFHKKRIYSCCHLIRSPLQVNIDHSLHLLICRTRTRMTRRSRLLLTQARNNRRKETAEQIPRPAKVSPSTPSSAPATPAKVSPCSPDSRLTSPHSLQHQSVKRVAVRASLSQECRSRSWRTSSVRVTT